MEGQMNKQYGSTTCNAACFGGALQARHTMHMRFYANYKSSPSLM